MQQADRRRCRRRARADRRPARSTAASSTGDERPRPTRRAARARRTSDPASTIGRGARHEDVVELGPRLPADAERRPRSPRSRRAPTRAPLRSSTALVATVDPCTTSAPGRPARQSRDARENRARRIVGRRSELVDDEPARVQPHEVGERPAGVDSDADRHGRIVLSADCARASSQRDSRSPRHRDDKSVTPVVLTRARPSQPNPRTRSARGLLRPGLVPEFAAGAVKSWGASRREGSRKRALFVRRTLSRHASARTSAPSATLRLASRPSRLRDTAARAGVPWPAGRRSSRTASTRRRSRIAGRRCGGPTAR